MKAAIQVVSVAARILGPSSSAGFEMSGGKLGGGPPSVMVAAIFVSFGEKTL